MGLFCVVQPDTAKTRKIKKTSIANRFTIMKFFYIGLKNYVYTFQAKTQGEHFVKDPKNFLFV